jgi:hypothetical protein
MAMETRPKLAAASLHDINAYGEIERDCIEAGISKLTPTCIDFFHYSRCYIGRGPGSFGITTRRATS